MVAPAMEKEYEGMAIFPLLLFESGMIFELTLTV